MKFIIFLYVQISLINILDTLNLKSKENVYKKENLIISKLNLFIYKILINYRNLLILIKNL